MIFSYLRIASTNGWFLSLIVLHKAYLSCSFIAVESRFGGQVKIDFLDGVGSDSAIASDDCAAYKCIDLVLTLACNLLKKIIRAENLWADVDLKIESAFQRRKCKLITSKNVQTALFYSYFFLIEVFSPSNFIHFHIPKPIFDLIVEQLKNHLLAIIILE